MHLPSVFAPFFLSSALLMAQAQPTPDGSIQVSSVQARNKAVAMRVFDEIFNQGKFQVADEIYAPDFQNHGLHRTVDLKIDQEYVHAEKKAFPDLRMSVQQMVAEGRWPRFASCFCELTWVIRHCIQPANSCSVSPCRMA